MDNVVVNIINGASCGITWEIALWGSFRTAFIEEERPTVTGQPHPTD